MDRTVSECPPKLCGSRAHECRFALWWDFWQNLREESIGSKAILSLLWPVVAGLWVLYTGLGQARYCSGL